MIALLTALYVDYFIEKDKQFINFLIRAYTAVNVHFHTANMQAK